MKSFNRRKAAVTKMKDENDKKVMGKIVEPAGSKKKLKEIDGGESNSSLGKFQPLDIQKKEQIIIKIIFNLV